MLCRTGHRFLFYSECIEGHRLAYLSGRPQCSIFSLGLQWGCHRRRARGWGGYCASARKVNLLERASSVENRLDPWPGCAVDLTYYKGCYLSLTEPSMTVPSAPAPGLLPAGQTLPSSLRSLPAKALATAGQLPEILVRGRQSRRLRRRGIFLWPDSQRTHPRRVPGRRPALFGVGGKVRPWNWPDFAEGCRRVPRRATKGKHERGRPASSTRPRSGISSIRLVTRHAHHSEPGAVRPGRTLSGRRRQDAGDHGSQGARTLLHSINTSNVVGLRDRAIVALLIYTAARAGAVATLRRGSFYDAGDQWMLHFEEKGGKSREIPVRHDLADR